MKPPRTISKPVTAAIKHITAPPCVAGVSPNRLMQGTDRSNNLMPAAISRVPKKRVNVAPNRGH
ncbi:hypothetical protein ABIE00_005282 [Arthrobacter sp. OAP107]